MPRLRNIHTGAVVSVSDETAARLDAEWEKVTDSKPAKKAAVKKSATKAKK